MKILWLSNKLLSQDDLRGTGTWLSSMAEGLLRSGEAELCNISEGPVREMTRMNGGALTQWAVPASEVSGSSGLPTQKIAGQILDAIESFGPDLIHVWGTEGFWGLLTARTAAGRTALLETQGLKFAIGRVFGGGLTFAEKLACIGVKELARRSTIFDKEREYRRWGEYEREIIAGHRYILVQTDWAESQVRAINPACIIHRSNCVLRGAFYRAQPWVYSGRPVLFCSASYSSPFKGIHVAVRAAAILKQTYPELELRIAGMHQRWGLRRDGYIAWVCREIERLGLAQNTVWLGMLSADEIVQEMHNASAMLVPTYIENCCTAMQEAMLAGIPVIASYTGGLPSLAEDEKSALFFPVGDHVMCARQCQRVIEDRELAEHLSRAGREVGCERNAPDAVLSNQIEIYRSIIDDYHEEE